MGYLFDYEQLAKDYITVHRANGSRKDLAKLSGLGMSVIKARIISLRNAGAILPPLKVEGRGRWGHE